MADVDSDRMTTLRASLKAAADYLRALEFAASQSQYMADTLEAEITNARYALDDIVEQFASA